MSRAQTRDRFGALRPEDRYERQQHGATTLRERQRECIASGIKGKGVCAVCNQASSVEQAKAVVAMEKASNGKGRLLLVVRTFPKVGRAADHWRNATTDQHPQDCQPKQVQANHFMFSR